MLLIQRQKFCKHARQRGDHSSIFPWNNRFIRKFLIWRKGKPDTLGVHCSILTVHCASSYHSSKNLFPPVCNYVWLNYLFLLKYIRTTIKFSFVHSSSKQYAWDASTCYVLFRLNPFLHLKRSKEYPVTFELNFYR